MLEKGAFLGVFSFAVAIAVQPAGSQEQRFDPPQTVQTRTLYDGRVSVRAQDASAAVRVTLQDWVIRNRQQIQLPNTGALVVEMRAGGKATTILNAQRVERKDGDYFDVRAGESLYIETENDTVVLTVLSITR